MKGDQCTFTHAIINESSSDDAADIKKSNSTLPLVEFNGSQVPFGTASTHESTKTDSEESGAQSPPRRRKPRIKRRTICQLPAPARLILASAAASTVMQPSTGIINIEGYSILHKLPAQATEHQYSTASNDTLWNVDQSIFRSAPRSKEPG